MDAEQIAFRMLDLGSFNIKAANLTDKKSKKLYQQLKHNPDGDTSGKQKGGKKVKQQAAVSAVPREVQPQDLMNGNVAEAQKQSRIFKELDNSLSSRLQDENPFDEFREAVERAIIEKSKKSKKVFEPDQSFFREIEDNGMCLSMHQPWASLMVHGFKRFEGREWTSKYRGPLWIHATS